MKLNKHKRAEIYHKAGLYTESRNQEKFMELFRYYSTKDLKESKLVHEDFNNWANGKSNPTLEERNEVRILIFYLLEQIALRP